VNQWWAVWRGGATAWTHAHERWLLAQQFDEPAFAATYAHYRVMLQARDAHLDAIEADLSGWYDRPPFAEQVARLSAYRASPGWARSRWPPGSATGAGSPRRASSWGSVG
jgi:hypothetical protein